MTLDFWGLGLQAINVLILVWLLSRIFWRPVAAAISKRQDDAKTLVATAQATQDKADAAMAQATKARAEISDERTKLLDAARQEAEAAAKASLADAQTRADAMLAAAASKIAEDAHRAELANASKASDLSLEIAAGLLDQLSGPAVQSAFLSQLVDAIDKLSAADRAALQADPQGIDVVSPTALGAQRATIEGQVRAALATKETLHFVTDPDLIAGLELRSPHFILRNSWQADLARVQKAVDDAA